MIIKNWLEELDALNPVKFEFDESFDDTELIKYIPELQKENVSIFSWVNNIEYLYKYNLSLNIKSRFFLRIYPILDHYFLITIFYKTDDIEIRNIYKVDRSYTKEFSESFTNYKNNLKLYQDNITEEKKKYAEKKASILSDIRNLEL